MTNYLAKYPPGVTVDKSSAIKLGWCGVCDYNTDTIYFFGEEDDLMNWVEVVIHEELHKTLFDIGVEAKYHHNFIFEEMELMFDGK